MLTDRQQEILKFIKEYHKFKHCSPSQREIQNALKIKSFAFINRVLDKLENLHFIKRNNSARNNIELCKTPYSLSLIGKIAAGKPIEAIAEEREIEITKKLLGENRYLLEVKGDSMIEDNICDGDWILCESCQSASNGTIVIALIKKQEATLKRIYYENERIKLEPANKNYLPQYYFAEDVEVQGRYIGLIRLAKK